jgi:hypothetical protein
MSLGTVVLIILILLLLGVLPTWPYSSGWGYYPSGGLGSVLVIVLILILLGRLSGNPPSKFGAMNRSCVEKPRKPVLNREDGPSSSPPLRRDRVPSQGFFFSPSPAAAPGLSHGQRKTPPKRGKDGDETREGGVVRPTDQHIPRSLVPHFFRRARSCPGT